MDAPELVHDRQDRNGLAERDALALKPGRVLTGLGQSPAKLEEQPRFPDAGLARHEHDLPPPRARLPEAFVEDVQFAGPPHQGSEPPFDGGVQARAPAPRP